jgi:hypothetical protein
VSFIDFKILQQMADESFIKNLKAKAQSFIEQLIEYRESSGNIISFLFLDYPTHLFPCVGISSTTTRSENTSSTVAIINTDDSNIKIILTLEVEHFNNFVLLDKVLYPLFFFTFSVL